MTDKPWWLWEGAAVRNNDWVCEVESFTPLEVRVTVTDSECYATFRLDQLTPIENPAVMLAPEGATHVLIAENLWCYYLTDSGGWMKYHEYKFRWPQCPDHLKGHTWELPRREA